MSVQLIVAVTEEEVQKLHGILENGRKNGVEGLELIGPKRIQEIEPHCTGGLAAIHSPHTGIVDFKEVAVSFGQEFKRLGGTIFLGFEAEEFKTQTGTFPPLSL